MKKSIKNLIVLFLEKEEIVSSWGLSNIRILDNELIFYVNAFKYTGDISIVSKENDLFMVKMRATSTEYEDIQTSQIIDFIDTHIEKTDDYLIDLATWLQKQ